MKVEDSYIREAITHWYPLSSAGIRSILEEALLLRKVAQAAGEVYLSDDPGEEEQRRLDVLQAALAAWRIALNKS